MPPDIQHRTRWLKEAAIRHGFMGVGVSRAEHMDVEAQRLEDWLGKGHHGEMGYMANHFEMRTDPTKLMPGAKSVISLMYNYFPKAKAEAKAKEGEPPPPFRERRSSAEALEGVGGWRISKYAYGEDYHQVVRRKLKALLHEMKTEFGDIHGRVFVDSAPVMERDWAKRSGLGWIGRNTLLIDPKRGSYFFLAEIILDVEFEYDHPIRDHCGTCTRCIDACPTDAISAEGYVLDGSKCISYLTIELRSAIPEEFKGKMEDWIFGCDICQEVCPWNRFSSKHEEPAFEMKEEVSGMTNADWKEMTEEVFENVFSKSAIKRAGWKGIQRNIEFVKK
jgi:epoxyqueuosine reductase